ncbi:MAG: DUF3429 domain-containing protein [Rhizobiaceae bacterium]
MKPEPLQKTAWYLTLSGFLPFAGLSIAMLVLGRAHPLFDVLTDAFRLYSAVILSFLGGIRWGLALNNQAARPATLTLSVIPAIAGWLSMFAPPVFSVGIFLLAFCAQGAWDSTAFHAGKGPIWFARLRIVITLLVAGAHIVALLALK